MVPQFDNLDPDFTVAENLLVYGRYFGMPATATSQARIPALLEFAGLAGRADAQHPDALGRHEAAPDAGARAGQRPAAACSWTSRPPGLDPQARHLIWERLRRLTQEGKTLILTTHFMEEAERLCNRLAIMDHGRIIAQGTPRALIAEHIEPQVVEVHGPRLRSVDGTREGASRRASSAPATPCSATRRTSSRSSKSLSRPAASLRYLHRPANLEDVFLKLTGRDLRD